MKNQKLKLDELKVQSFVTDFDKEQGQTQEINGGTGRAYCIDPSQLIICLGPRLTITRNISCFAATCNYALCNPEQIPTKIPTDFPVTTTTWDGGTIRF
ncbi:hypothetical protein AAE02nite_05670 [Adhaeribacter aerolatus]|uniref:Uncharacterized protein n=1 Tax=Adhaeribacter aerolatus TaxID=670289 RepID=A0A512AT87_9BACT|nr:pinensin family lanthipeptide [Adhaeribacter aerolatus]GEO02903.1 hypothetical protein AAE02nite_05670 [Adhaeribacter aerolatus]